ncbi:MAG: hypothetical protein Q4B96_04990 [Bacillota bacterium]|nr:hypothetical protein [Bacillota bacterium]
MKKYKHRTRLIAIVLSMLLLCSLLSGCRESPVLRQVIYEASAPEVDENETMLDSQESGLANEDFDEQEDEDAETPRDSETTQGLTGEDNSAEQSMEEEYSATGENDWQADNAPTSAPEQTADAEGGAQPAEQAAADTAAPVAGGNSAKQIVDAAGRTVELPENVGSAAAVGWAAQAVSMLSGGGLLAAADEEFLSASLAASAFDLSAVSSSWSGDGSSYISDEAFAQLLSKKPGVCFEISGQRTFSDAQVTQLTAAGIPYVVLPSVTSLANLKQAVSLIAAVLAQDTPDDPITAAANAYIAWLDGIVREVAGKTDAQELTSLYLADWDDNAAYTLNYTKGAIEAQGSGMAVAWSPLKSQIVSDCMAAANVVNEATRIRSTHRESEGLYVSPMFHQFDPAVSGTKGVYYSGSGEYGAAFDLFVSRMISNTVYYQLGSEAFPALIVADESIKAAVEENWFWQYHPTDNNGYITINGESFYCGVVGDYEIYVNPRGMCDWTEGSLESPLEAVWLAYKFHNAYTLAEVKQIAADFYRQFFGLALTDAELREIFGE